MTANMMHCKLMCSVRNMGEKHLDFINGEVGFRRGGILVDVEPVEPGFPLIIRRGPVSVVVAHEHLDEGTLAPPRGPREAPVRLESLDVRGPVYVEPYRREPRFPGK